MKFERLKLNLTPEQLKEIEEIEKQYLDESLTETEDEQNTDGRCTK